MTAESGEASGPADPAEGPAAEECAACLSVRGVIFALGFAVFAAYVAADFATGGRLTALVAGTLATLRGRAGEG